MATYRWISTTTNGWTNGTAWDLGSAPATSADVLFNGLSGTGTCIVSANTNNIGSLTITSGFPANGITFSGSVPTIRIAPTDLTLSSCFNVYEGFTFSSVNRTQIGEIDIMDSNCSHSATIYLSSTMAAEPNSMLQLVDRTCVTKRGIKLLIQKMNNVGFLTGQVIQASAHPYGGNFSYLDNGLFNCPWLSDTVSANYPTTYYISAISGLGVSGSNSMSISNPSATFPNLRSITYYTVNKGTTTLGLTSPSIPSGIDLTFIFVGNLSANSISLNTNSNLIFNNVIISAVQPITTASQSFGFSHPTTLNISGDFTLFTSMQRTLSGSLVRTINFIGQDQTIDIESNYITKVSAVNPNQVLRFVPTSATLTISANGSTIGGTSAGLVTLRSTQEGSATNIAFTSPVTLTYVAVRDINSTSATMDMSSPTNKNYGGNTGDVSGLGYIVGDPFTPDSYVYFVVPTSAFTPSTDVIYNFTFL